MDDQQTQKTASQTPSKHEEQDPSAESKERGQGSAQQQKTEIHHHYHYDRQGGMNFGRIFLGLIILVIGMMYLANNLGWMNLSLHFNASMIWPLVLIFIGLSLFQRRGWFGGVFGILLTLLVVVVIAIMVFGVDMTGTTTVSTTRSVEIQKSADITSARVAISSGAGKLIVKGGSSQLVSGTFASNFLTLSQSSQVADKIQDVSLKTEGKWTGFGHKVNTFDLLLNSMTPFALTFDTGAIDMNIDLRTVMATSVDISTGASKLTLVLGDTVASSAVSIDAGASSIDITVPKSVGTQVKIDSGASSKQLDDFTKVDDKTYATDNYSTAEKKITIDLTVGATSLNVHRQ